MIRRLAFFVLIIFCFSGCPINDSFMERSYFLMGTLVTITLPHDYSHEFKNVSAFIGSLAEEVNVLSASDDVVSPFICRLLKNAEFYYDISGGRFNIGISGVVSLYGFPEGPYSEPDSKTLKEAVELSKRRIKVYENEGGCFASSDGGQIDLGALAKGAIVDEAAAYLKKQGIYNFIINAGGDLYASGEKNGKKWRLGITDPQKRGSIIETVELQNMAIATSGTYERYFITKDGRRISHLFDGTTGKTAERYISVSVIAESAEKADALSTAYFFMDEEEIASVCTAMNTPVMLITARGERKTFCAWG